MYDWMRRGLTMAPDDPPTGGGAPPPAADPPAADPTAPPPPRVAEPPVPMGMPEFASLRQALPAALRDNPLFDRYGEAGAEGATPRGVAGVFEDLVGAQTLIGGNAESVPRPKEDAPPEAWESFYNSLGRPESAEGYDLGEWKPPEGLDWDGELQRVMTEKLHKRGLSNTQFKGAISDFAEVQSEMVERAKIQSDQQFADAETRLKSEWGVEYEGRRENARKAFEAAFGESASLVGRLMLPDGHEIGTHPLFIAAFDRLGATMKEDGVVDGSAAGGIRWDPASAKEELARMEREDATTLLDKNASGHAELKAKQIALLKAAFPE